jgi:hypothetical protein
VLGCRGISASPRFDPSTLAALDEPVRRYLLHAIDAGAGLSDRMTLTMAGRIDVGRRLSFTAEQQFSGHAFTWRAKAGLGPLKPLRVVDSYRPGAGSTVGTLLGVLPFLRADDANTARSAAGRAAGESVWVPQTLVPGRGATWRAETENLIVAEFDVPPERPELRLRITETGAVRSVSLDRWGDVGRDGFGYIPFGGDIHAESRFGSFTLPSRVSIGWWYGTARFKPFFDATIRSAEQAG